MNLNKRVLYFGLLFLGLNLSVACKMSVSLSGATIDPRAATISIATFPNQATLIKSTLSQDFTNTLKDKFQSQTSLSITDRNGDYQLEGEIVSYIVTPAVNQADQRAALNRLTITVNVRFKSRFDETKNFEERFSRFVDYDSKLSFPSVENELVTEINKVLADEIFKRALVNW